MTEAPNVPRVVVALLSDFRTSRARFASEVLSLVTADIHNTAEAASSPSQLPARSKNGEKLVAAGIVKLLHGCVELVFLKHVANAQSDAVGRGDVGAANDGFSDSEEIREERHIERTVASSLTLINTVAGSGGSRTSAVSHASVGDDRQSSQQLGGSHHRPSDEHESAAISQLLFAFHSQKLALLSQLLNLVTQLTLSLHSDLGEYLRLRLPPLLVDPDAKVRQMAEEVIGRVGVWASNAARLRSAATSSARQSNISLGTAGSSWQAQGWRSPLGTIPELNSFSDGGSFAGGGGAGGTTSSSAGHLESPASAQGFDISAILGDSATRIISGGAVGGSVSGATNDQVPGGANAHTFSSSSLVLGGQTVSSYSLPYHSMTPPYQGAPTWDAYSSYPAAPPLYNMPFHPPPPSLQSLPSSQRYRLVPLAAEPPFVPPAPIIVPQQTQQHQLVYLGQQSGQPPYPGPIGGLYPPVYHTGIMSQYSPLYSGATASSNTPPNQAAPRYYILPLNNWNPAAGGFTNLNSPGQAQQFYNPVPQTPTFPSPGPPIGPSTLQVHYIRPPANAPPVQPQVTIPRSISMPATLSNLARVITPTFTSRITHRRASNRLSPPSLDPSYTATPSASLPNSRERSPQSPSQVEAVGTTDYENNEDETLHLAGSSRRLRRATAPQGRSHRSSPAHSSPSSPSNESDGIFNPPAKRRARIVQPKPKVERTWRLKKRGTRKKKAAAAAIAAAAASENPAELPHESNQQDKPFDADQEQWLVDQEQQVQAVEEVGVTDHGVTNPHSNDVNQVNMIAEQSADSFSQYGQITSLSRTVTVSSGLAALPAEDETSRAAHFRNSPRNDFSGFQFPKPVENLSLDADQQRIQRVDQDVEGQLHWDQGVLQDSNFTSAFRLASAYLSAGDNGALGYSPISSQAPNELVTSRTATQPCSFPTTNFRASPSLLSITTTAPATAPMTRATSMSSVTSWGAGAAQLADELAAEMNLRSRRQSMSVEGPTAPNAQSHVDKAGEYGVQGLFSQGELDLVTRAGVAAGSRRFLIEGDIRDELNEDTQYLAQHATLSDHQSPVYEEEFLSRSMLGALGRMAGMDIDSTGRLAGLGGSDGS
ncbi:hypothetical protein HDU93_007456, partial [Gonapodya sp. JEL0774]